VIVSHDTRQELRRCLDAIGSGCSDVIVVDSGSSDGSAALVSSAYPQVRLIALDNLGFGAAANAGIACAHGRHVLVLNADARPLPGALAALTELAELHPNAGVIGPRLRTPDGALQRSVFASPRGPISLAAWATAPGLVSGGARAVRRLTGAYRRRLRHAPPTGVQELVGFEYVQGSAMLLRRKALDAVGGFDEQFFMYCEEADVCYRLRQAGWSVLFTPECEFVHVGGASTSKCADDMYGELMRAHMLLLTKHAGRTAGERARRLVVVAMRVRATFHVGARQRRYTAASAALARENRLGPNCGP
jgi:GT2 family glycosyltransferase